MALKHTANVPLSVKVKDKDKLVDKGELLPAGVDERVLSALVSSGLVAVAEQAPAPATPPDPDTLPAERDNREVWDAYAVKVGVDPVQYSKKPELVAEVTRAHEAKVAADGSDGSGGDA